MIHLLKRQARRILTGSVRPLVMARLPQRTDLPPSRFGLDVGENGHLYLGEVDLVDLVETHGSPLQVVHGPRLDQAAAAAVAPSTDDPEPGCEIFYSYKTNPIPAVLDRLHAAGVGAEVISAFELWLALELGVAPDRIIYNGPAKSTESIRTAVEQGILLINANTVDEAERIAAVAADVGRVVSLGIRASLPGMWGGQFGISNIDVFCDVVERAVADDRVDLCGIHVHRGVTIRTEQEMIDHVNQTLDFLDEIRERTGWYPSLLDLGGSLACATVAGFDNREFRLNRFLGSDLTPPDPTDTIDLPSASRLAARLVRERAVAAGREAPRVFLEPGRALTANTQLLLTSVLDVKTDGDLAHAIIDAGLNIAETASSEYHQLFSASDVHGKADHHYRLAGPICTPADVLYNDWRLPELARGHVLAIMDTGAYFVPFSTSFSFPRPPIVVCRDGKVEVARAAEAFGDLVGLDSWAGRNQEDS